MTFDREKAREILHAARIGAHADDELLLDSLAECVTRDPHQFEPYSEQIPLCVVCERREADMFHAGEEYAKTYAEARQAEAKVAAVLALHKLEDNEMSDGTYWCDACNSPYPCPTARACGVNE